jgi:PiT family inorganic phosphate transporter
VQTTLLVVLVAVGLLFAWTNGFHDASNAVATALRTGALTPRAALTLATVLNALGSLLGVDIAILVGHELLDVPVTDPAVGLVIAALTAAIGWNLLTWWFGLPSSSSHALIGALAGAGIVAGVTIDWGLLRDRVLAPMLISPLIGLVAAWALTMVLMRVFRSHRHQPTVRRFRLAQTVSASAMALGHGLQDGQKAMGAIVLGLVAAGVDPQSGVPMWVRVTVAGAMAAGTAAGGRRIIRTLARRVAPIDPVIGFSSEAVAAGVLYSAAGVLGVPVSSTHTVTAAIVGAGATRGVRRIRWGTVRRILVAWIATPVMSAAAAAAVFLLVFRGIS